jgi:hypothetical protein
MSKGDWLALIGFAHLVGVGAWFGISIIVSGLWFLE